MKKFIIPLAACSLLVFAACSDPQADKAKEFSASFANLVNSAKTDSVIAVYPDAEFAEKLEIDYVADSVSISKTDKENNFRINYGGGTSMVVEIPEDASTVKVLSSYGLFSYPQDKTSFAKKVGALKGEITDRELADRMVKVDDLSTKLFNDYVTARKNAVKNLGATITKESMFMMDEGRGFYTLKNNTDQPIAGDDYQITWEVWYIGSGIDSHKSEIEKGKDIPAGGTVKIPFSFTGHAGSSIKAITVKTPSKEDFFKNYTPSGKEYDEYIAKYGDKLSASNKLSDGPYNLAGKLGGKYAVHVNLEKGMKKGTYYYDKSGANAKLNLSIKEFNPNTGELTMEETNDKGQVTGTFIGTLTSEAYTGKMTAFSGKTYSFTLAVE